VSAKPAYIANFGDRGISYGNRREGDRIAQDPHQAIKNNHYNAFAYSPSPGTPMASLAVNNRPLTLVAPDPAAAAERKEQQALKKQPDEQPASMEKPRGGKTASTSSVPLPRAEPKTNEVIPAEMVPLPQARPHSRRHRR
jgi:hypothetical protein